MGKKVRTWNFSEWESSNNSGNQSWGGRGFLWLLEFRGSSDSSDQSRKTMERWTSAKRPRKLNFLTSFSTLLYSAIVSRDESFSQVSKSSRSELTRILPQFSALWIIWLTESHVQRKNSPRNSNFLLQIDRYFKHDCENLINAELRLGAEIVHSPGSGDARNGPLSARNDHFGSWAHPRNFDSIAIKSTNELPWPQKKTDPRRRIRHFCLETAWYQRKTYQHRRTTTPSNI